MIVASRSSRSPAYFRRAHQRRDAVGGFRVAFEDVVDLLGAAVGGIVLEHRRPFAAVAADQIVPFRVARDRNADFGLLRCKSRDVHRSATARLAFAIRRLCLRLLEAHRFVERLPRRFRRRGEVPEPLMIVAIGRLDHVSARIELHPHLPEIVAEKAADAAADRRVGPAHTFGEEQVAALAHPGVGVEITRIEQRAGEPCHQRRRGHDAAGVGQMEREPETAQARKAADRQLLDAGVLDQ